MGAFTRILFVRHGETNANKQRIVQGRTIDHPLNELGLQQAEKLAQRLQNETIHTIFSSPQRRAYQTAEAISGYHPQAPLVVRLDLAENSMGRLEGVSLEKIEKEFPKQDWDQENFRTKVGAESLTFYKKHFARHLPAWLEENLGKTVLASSHGGKIKIILRNLLQQKYLEHIERSHPGNTSLTEVRWTPQTGGELIVYNDTSHL